MWITDFRAQFGLTIPQLGAAIRRHGARQEPPLRVSDILLERLETDPNFRTVPKLADLIAEACGASAKQRDALVLPQYRGKGKNRRAGRGPLPAMVKKEAPTPKPTAPAEAPQPKPPAPRREFNRARQVVKVNAQGEELRRYGSCNAAARNNPFTECQVTRRCHRRCETDEFRQAGYTFRFAAEWDAMTRDERLADLTATRGAVGRRGSGTHGAQMVTVIGRHGSIRHFDSIKAAAEGCGVGYALLQKLLSQAQNTPTRAAELDGVRFMFTTTWDNLDAGE